MDVKATLEIVVDEIINTEERERHLIERRLMAEKLAVVLGENHPIWEQFSAQIREAEPELTLEIEDLRRQREDLIERGKELTRQVTKGAVNHRGWVCTSRAGKRVRDWDVGIIRSLYPSLEISGKPLVETREFVNQQVWDQGVKLGVIKLDKVVALGGYKETSHKRSAFFYNEAERAASKEALDE